MNENQKAFLNELTDLLEKYAIKEMIIFDGRIAMSSNEEVLAFESFIHKSDELSYFCNIMTTQNKYEVQERE